MESNLAGSVKRAYKGCPWNVVQVHHQHHDGRTTFVGEVKPVDPQTIDQKLQVIRAAHPLPSDAQWLYCNERAEYYVQQKEEGS